jgi:ACT domain-containing protein
MKQDINNFNFTVVPSDFLSKIEQDVKELKMILRQKSEQEISDQWIESVKIPKVLGISRKTWQTYRDKRLIPFSQIGSKIYVKRADIEKFMSDHYIEAADN